MHVLVGPFSENYLVAHAKLRIIDCVGNSDWITQHQSPPLNHLLYRCGLRICDELPAILRKLWRSAQALAWTAHVPFGDPVCRTELRQGGHGPHSGKIRLPLDVNLWACKSSLSES